jgi:hypothetical protein
MTNKKILFLILMLLFSIDIAQANYEWNGSTSPNWTNTIFTNITTDPYNLVIGNAADFFNRPNTINPNLNTPNINRWMSNAINGFEITNNQLKINVTNAYISDKYSTNVSGNISFILNTTDSTNSPTFRLGFYQNKSEFPDDNAIIGYFIEINTKDSNRDIYIYENNLTVRTLKGSNTTAGMPSFFNTAWTIDLSNLGVVNIYLGFNSLLSANIGTNRTQGNVSFGGNDKALSLLLDDYRIWNSTSGYVKLNYNSSPNSTYQLTVNGTTPTNTNVSIQYSHNTSTPTDFFATFNASLNNSWSLSPQYNNTDAYIWLFGNGTSTPQISNITMYDALAPVTPLLITSCRYWCFIAMNSSSQVLLDIYNNYTTTLIQGIFDTPTQSYITHRTGFTPNQYSIVYQKYGYYIYTPSLISISTNITTNPNITLNTGWNLVGNMNTTRTLLELKTSIGATATSASHFNITTQTYITTDSEIVPVANAFFVYTNANTVWSG